MGCLKKLSKITKTIGIVQSEEKEGMQDNSLQINKVWQGEVNFLYS